MDCRKFDEILHDLDRNGTEGAALSEEALVHAEICDRCASILTEAEALDFGLRAISKQDATKQAPPRVEAELVQQFRRERNQRTHRGMEWRLAALAAAATILIVLGLALVHRQATVPAGLHSGESAATQSPSGVATLNAAPSNTARSPEAWRAPETKPLESQAIGARYSTAFVPLPDADEATAEEGAVVVRVILPESALASFGFPATGDEGEDRVTADLVVGVDGTPQAIRLVSPAAARETY